MPENLQELDALIARTNQFSVFVQPDGPSPANAWVYVGCLSLGGFSEDLGTGDPIYCPSSDTPGKFNIVDETAPPPSLPTTDFTQHMNRMLSDFWFDMRKRQCSFNMAVKGSACARPDDPDDFESKIIARRVKVTQFTTGAFNQLGEEAVLDLTGSLQMRAFDRFRPLTFGEKADTATFSEALDGIFADAVQCGDCGTVSDGSQRAYVLTSTIAASPALASQVVYTLDGGRTWTTENINSLSTIAGNAIARVGTRIVVVSQTDLAHHHKLQATIDAGSSPGAGWTKVSTGYVTSKGPRAIWTHNTNQTYIAAAGGYVYLMTSPTAGVTVLTDGTVTTQNLNDIRGSGRTIVAVGASNAVIVSSNDGRTWSSITGPAVGQTLNTVEVIDANIWFIGAGNGKSYYTVNGGRTWVEFTPDSSLTAINRIRFVDEVVGYMAAKISGGVRVYRTGDGGYSWHADRPYVDTVPTCDHFNFLALTPNNYDLVLTGGLKTSPSTDGIIVLGAA